MFSLFAGVGVFAAFLMILLVVGILLIPFIFYLLTLQNTLKAIAPQNRYVRPEQVWLMFIPFFNIVWQFILVDRLASSIQKELNMRGIHTNERPTYNIGLAYCILGLAGWVPLLGTLTGIATVVCWIIHWVKVSEFKDKFLSEPFTSDKQSDIFGNFQY